MPVLHLTNPEQTRDQARRSRRIPVLWPWLLVGLAWAVLVLATLAHQTFLLDHHYLLQASGLPWLAALEVFLLCWQLMTVVSHPRRPRGMWVFPGQEIDWSLFERPK